MAFGPPHHRKEEFEEVALPHTEALFNLALNLTRGTHRLTFAVDLNERKQGLRLELKDAPGSPAQVQIINGK